MKERILYEGQYLRLMQRGNWEYAERMHCSGIVFIVARTDDGKLILCEQFRMPVDRKVIEIPAGLVNDGASDSYETMEEAARRELWEETGYEARSMTELLTGPAAPGSSSMVVTFFEALGLKKTGRGGGDASENILVHEVPLADMDRWIADQSGDPSKWIDPKIYVGLYFLQNKTKR